ncbi:sugar phosphate isomerase/epimerase family protein [Salinicola sp. CPA57]|uniref:sugar phosphate isomerase/epimerase family protein n=1 Tax=Salinicola sp. CPA57 TaxID=1949080 RepID=UPI000DA10905|nr:sugar phosphate isomerase/epimerase family protein [Salinicola sp. CPA57]
MKIGIVTDSLANLSVDELFGLCARQGIEEVEFAIGNWSNSPHIDASALLDSQQQRRELQARLDDHGLRISAFNANGNQLHPTDGKRQDEVVRQAIRLAEHFGLSKVNLMSGLPAGAAGDSTPNWITNSWPPETQRTLDYQWNQVAIPYWQELVKYANEHGVQQICIEPHGNQLVYNMPTFLRLHDAVGDTVGLNFDPSHQFWMGGDPLEVVKLHASHIYHVHAKDTYLHTGNLAMNTCLDHLPMEQFQDRSWSYVTLGYGHGESWWREFCYWLQAGGYQDGVLSIEHEDINLSRQEGVIRSVELLRQCMPTETPDYELPS